MSSPKPESYAFEPLPPARALRWWAAGLALWKRARFRWWAASLVPLLAEAAFQLIPIVGVIVSKLANALVSAGLYVVLDELAKTGRFSWRGVAWSFRAENAGRALRLAILMLAPFAAQVLVALALYGFAGVDVMLFARVAEHRDILSGGFVLAVLLPGTVPDTLLLFAMPLVVLRGMRVRTAAAWSLRWMFSAPASAALTLAISLLLLALALPFFLPVLWLAPWMGAMGYAAYADVFGGPGAWRSRA